MITTNATEVGDPTSDCNGVGLSHGVWFTINSPSHNTRFNLSTCGSLYTNSDGSTGNTDLQVYTNGCGALGNALICSHGSNPSFGCPNFDAGVTLSAPSNTIYYIFASGVNTGSGVLNITATFVDPPTNDSCASPITLTNGEPYVMITTNATEVGDPTSDCNGVGLSHGVWFTINSPSHNTRFNLSTCGSLYTNSDGSTGNTDLQVYTNGCGALGNALICSHGSNPSFGCPNFDAGVTLSAPSNTMYYILASGVNTASGVLNITATFVDPPTNDSCAFPITLTNNEPYVMSTVNATEVGDPTSDCNGVGLSHGVWFTLSASAGQPVTISTCGSLYSNSDGSTGNTDLQIYTNGCDALGNALLCSHGSNPSFCAGGFAGVSFTASNDAIYYILASGVGTASGTLQISANLPPPTNDACTGAVAMVSGVTYAAATAFATSGGDPTPSCVPTFGRGVWYSYQPSVDGPVGVTTCGSSFQTALAVYTGACGSWHEIACSQNSGAYCTSGNADVNFYGTNGMKYYILAGGVNGAAGALQIEIPIVDLASTGLVASNSAGGLITAGRNLNAFWTVKNQGSTSITGPWADTLSLSNAVTNVVLATFNSVHSAPAGGSYPEGNFNIPVPQIPAGTDYLLIAQADVAGAVAELNKTNNVQALSVTVTNLPPTIILLFPTNLTDRVSCVAVPIGLSAQTQSGSYTITNVIFYDGSIGNVIGSATNVPYSTNSVALDLGTHIIGVLAQDNFGLTGISSNLATNTIHYPTNLLVLRADLATNGDFVGCMCAVTGSNYVILATTNLKAPASWLPYVTNQAFSNAVAFTNHPALPQRFFRAQLLP